MGKYEAREIQNLSDFVKEENKEIGNNIRTLKDTNSINRKIWELSWDQNIGQPKELQYMNP